MEMENTNKMENAWQVKEDHVTKSKEVIIDLNNWYNWIRPREDARNKWKRKEPNQAS